MINEQKRLSNIAKLKTLNIKRTTRQGNIGAWFINGQYIEYIIDAHQVAEKILNTKLDYLDFKSYLLRR